MAELMVALWTLTWSSVQVGAPWKWRVSGPMTHVCSFMDRSTSLVSSSVLTDLHLCLHLWYTNGCMLVGAKWHPTPESGDSFFQQDNVSFVVFEIWTTPTTPPPHSSQQSMLASLQVLLSLLVCLVWCECTWGPVTVGYCCIICLTVTVWQTLQALLLTCSVHSSCHSVSHSVLYCSLFTPAV